MAENVYRIDFTVLINLLDVKLNSTDKVFSIIAYKKIQKTKVEVI